MSEDLEATDPDLAPVALVPAWKVLQEKARASRKNGRTFIPVPKGSKVILNKRRKQ